MKELSQLVRFIVFFGVSILAARAIYYVTRFIDKSKKGGK